VLHANAIYQTTAISAPPCRYVIAQELVRLAREEGCDSSSPHSAASKGNDQVRRDPIATQDPKLKVLAPVRDWNLRNPEDKLSRPQGKYPGR